MRIDGVGLKFFVVEPGPSFSVDDVRRGLVSGLKEHGHQVASFNLGDRVDFFTTAHLSRNGEMRPAFDFEAGCVMACQGIKSACWDFLPDVVVIVSSFFVPPEIYENLRERKRHVVLWLTEAPYEDERQIPMARYADTVIVNDPTNLDEYRKQNPRTYYLPHCYDPAVHHSDGRKDVHDFTFVGTGFDSRVEFFEKVNWPCSPLFAGNWQRLGDASPLVPHVMDRRYCLENSDTANLYRTSKTSANLYRKEAMSPDLVDGWAMGPREVELAACGTWFARESRPEGDDLFPMLPTFTEPAEFADQLRWALEHPDERETAARAAQAAIADRTFKNNTSKLLQLIGA